VVLVLEQESADLVHSESISEAMPPDGHCRQTHRVRATSVISISVQQSKARKTFSVFLSGLAKVGYIGFRFNRY